MHSFSDSTIRDFLNQAASDAPVPGGGGIAALVAALGASMASMAANFTVDRPKFAEYDALMRDTLAKLSPLIDGLRDGMDADARAFSGISLAYKLPRGTEEEKSARKAAIQAALAASMREPMAVLEKCLAAAELLPSLAGAGNPNLLSDVEVAAIMLEAAAKAARTNVLVNSGQLAGDGARQAETEADRIVAKTAALAASAIGVIAGRRKA